MKNKDNIPQMLKEILDRGYSEQSGNYVLDEGMFNYIHPRSDVMTTFPDRRLLVLEGLPGAGKTTLKEIFSKKDSFYVIDQILPNNPEVDSELTLDYILNSDEEKTKIFNFSTQSNILLDRYYASTLAFNWSYDKVFGTDTYTKVETWYEESIKKNILIKPFAVFLIEVPIEYAFSRKGRTPENNSSNPWIRTDFLEYFRQYYDYFYTEVEKKTCVIKIDGTQSLDIIVGIVNKYAKRK